MQKCIGDYNRIDNLEQGWEDQKVSRKVAKFFGHPRVTSGVYQVRYGCLNEWMDDECKQKPLLKDKKNRAVFLL